VPPFGSLLGLLDPNSREEAQPNLAFEIDIFGDGQNPPYFVILEIFDNYVARLDIFGNYVARFDIFENYVVRFDIFENYVGIQSR
jgi:hypothetical protein